MRKSKLIENYGQLSYDTVSPLAHTVIAATTGSQFLTKGAELVKSLAAALTLYDADVNAVPNPTPAETAHRDQLRTAVTTELARLGKRLNLDYPADEAALLSSGLTMAAASSTVPSRILAADTAVMNVELADGAQSGYLLIKLARPTGTLQNLIRYATDPAQPDEHWAVAVGGGREREIGPFASGTRVRVKVAALTGSTTEPVYSVVVSRLVQ